MSRATRATLCLVQEWLQGQAALTLECIRSPLCPRHWSRIPVTFMGASYHCPASILERSLLMPILMSSTSSSTPCLAFPHPCLSSLRSPKFLHSFVSVLGCLVILGLVPTKVGSLHARGFHHTDLAFLTFRAPLMRSDELFVPL